jgi:hypothetical protein
MKAQCNFECYSNGICPFPDCITDEITPQERLAQDRRDRNYSTYGVITPARRQRKDRGRRT